MIFRSRRKPAAPQWVNPEWPGLSLSHYLYCIQILLVNTEQRRQLSGKFSGDDHHFFVFRRQGEQRGEQRPEAGADQRGVRQVSRRAFDFDDWHVRNIEVTEMIFYMYQEHWDDFSYQEHSGIQRWIQHCWGWSKLKPKLWNGSWNLKSRIQESKTQTSWIQKAKNLKSRIRKSIVIQKNLKLIIDKYIALPPTVRWKPLRSEKNLPKPKTEHSTQWGKKYLWIVISRIVNSGKLW